MITNLKIKIDKGNGIEMTMEDAKKLYKSLHELFGKDKTVIKHVHEHEYTWVHPWYQVTLYPYTYPMLYTDGTTITADGTLTIDASGGVL